MSRKEREEVEKIQRQKEYQRRHDAGETDEAKADLGRLKEIKARREKEAKKKEDEKKAKEAESAKKIAASHRMTDDQKKEKAAKKEKKDKKAKKEKKDKKAKEEDSMFEFDLSSDSEDDTELLEPRVVKKMNPSQCKEKLKELGLAIQGNKKDLQQRLLDFYASKKK